MKELDKDLVLTCRLRCFAPDDWDDGWDRDHIKDWIIRHADTISEAAVEASAMEAPPQSGARGGSATVSGSCDSKGNCSVSGSVSVSW